MPAFVRLIYSQSDRYMPQFGLTFAHYLHMPTVSSHPLDQPGQSHSTTQPAPLTDRQGFNFQTTEHVIDIQASAMLPHPSDAESAIDIARQINTSVLFCKTLLTGLRHCESPTPQQQKALNHLLDHVEMTVLIGEHSANRIDAALAWARLARGEGKVSDCVIPLDRSVEAWKKVVEIAANLYPEPVDYWQSRFVSVPPWSAAQLAESYEHVRGHWSDMLPVFERELNLIRQSLSMNRSQRNLPMWDLLTAEPWANLHSIHRIGFEHSGEADPRYAIHEGTSIVSDPALVLSEGHSLAIDTTDMSDETHLVFETLPSFATLPAGRPLQINFVYRVIDRGQPFNTPFECGIYDKETDTMLGERPRWGAPTGHVAPRVIHVPPLDSDQYRVGFVVHGRAAIVIDLLNIQYIKDF
jgi:hypothetical protein